MGNEKLNKLLIGFIILVACFALDRFSKIYILNILNNDTIDYVAQAVFCCKKIKEHLKLPVTLITSENVKEDIFDNVIKIENPNIKQI